MKANTDEYRWVLHPPYALLCFTKLNEKCSCIKCMPKSVATSGNAIDMNCFYLSVEIHCNTVWLLCQVFGEKTAVVDLLVLVSRMENQVSCDSPGSFISWLWVTTGKIKHQRDPLSSLICTRNNTKHGNHQSLLWKHAHKYWIRRKHIKEVHLHYWTKILCSIKSSCYLHGRTRQHELISLLSMAGCVST